MLLIGYLFLSRAYPVLERARCLISVCPWPPGECPPWMLDELLPLSNKLSRVTLWAVFATAEGFSVCDALSIFGDVLVL